MRLVTWNLNGLDDNFVNERTEAAVFLAAMGMRLDQLTKATSAARRINSPDVILFQELTPTTFYGHVWEHLPRGGYKVLPEVAPERQCFEAIAYRQTIDLISYDTEPLDRSRYGRVLHTAEFAESRSKKAFRVLTAHFDSGPEAHAIRKTQLRQVAKSLGARGIFGGDANLRKAEWETSKERLEMADAWETLGEPPASRFTWQMTDRHARFDRIFHSAQILPNEMTLIGEEPLPGYNIAISDHFGISCKFELTV